MKTNTDSPSGAAAGSAGRIVRTVTDHEKLFVEAMAKAGLSEEQIEKVMRIYNESLPLKGRILDLERTPGTKYTTLDAVARKGCHGSVARPM